MYNGEPAPLHIDEIIMRFRFRSQNVNLPPSYPSSAILIRKRTGNDSNLGSTNG